MTITLEDWATIAQAKQQRNLDSIPNEWRIKPVESVHVMDIPGSCGILNADELKITDTPAQDLVAQMRKGGLKSYDVVLAFAKRAAIAHQLVSLQQVQSLYADQLPIGDQL
jgi:amidase